MSSQRVTVYVPRDSASRSVGADAVARASRQAPPRAAGTSRWCATVREACSGSSHLSRSRTADGRVAYGPVHPDDVVELVADGMLDGADHPLALGPTEEIPWLSRQQRLTFARVGVIDPLSAADYQAHGGIAGLRKALETHARGARRSRSPIAACVDAVGPASPPASSGTPSARPKGR